MAITQAMCTSFKTELLTGTHNFTNSTGDTFKLALYAIGSGGKSSTTATLGASTTAFTTTGEVASSGSYATGGGTLTNVTPTSSGTTAFECIFKLLQNMVKHNQIVYAVILCGQSFCVKI